MLRLARHGEEIALSRSGRSIGVLHFEARNDASPQAGRCRPSGTEWSGLTAEAGSGVLVGSPQNGPPT